MVTVPPVAYKAVIGIGAVGMLCFSLVFLVGWLRARKNMSKTDAAMIFGGGSLTVLGLLIYLGLFGLSFVQYQGNFTLGIIFTPLGVLLLVYGLLNPVKFKSEFEDV